MKRPQIVAGKIYHILNRGVDKRVIFPEESDYVRFIHDLYEFNNINHISNVSYHYNKQKQYIVTGLRYIGKTENQGKREPLVEILAFCLMKNHYHLMIIPKSDNALSIFMKRLNQGYSRHINEKYDRSGTLFEGRYKAILIEKEEHFIHLPYYIHLNPLDYYMPEWRKREIINPLKAIEFLEKYRWSSFPDYVGIKNFSSVTQREFLGEFFNNPIAYRKATLEWLQSCDLNSLSDITLEPI
ncbi:MAG: transposase [bacterium]|nr:transposase [bacterium]